MKSLIVITVFLVSVSSFAESYFGPMHRPYVEYEDGKYTPESLITIKGDQLRVQKIYSDRAKKEVQVYKIEITNEYYRVIEEISRTECYKASVVNLESDTDFLKFLDTYPVRIRNYGVVSISADESNSLDKVPSDMMDNLRENNLLIYTQYKIPSQKVIDRINNTTEGC